MHSSRSHSSRYRARFQRMAGHWLRDAYRHADAYKLLEDVQMVAAVPTSSRRTAAICRQVGFSDVFDDYNEMLAEVKPDIVSICTWPHLHERMVIDCAQAGVPAVHCEKPMADTWGGAGRMVEACRQSGTKLTFAHQRRYGKPFSLAKKMLDEGRIGTLQKVEWGVGDLYDYGSHNLDMANYFNDECKTK